MSRPGAAGVVAFDLDGTLIDSATDLAAAASALAVELGGRALTRAEVVAMVGEGAPVLVRRALTAAGLDPATAGALDRFLALYDERLLDTTRLYPGVRQVLDALDPQLTLAVLTNKPRVPAERLLDALGVRPLFLEVVGGDGPLPRKPDPAGLRSLRLHADGGPLILVGDSPVDAETGAACRRAVRAGRLRLRRGGVRQRRGGRRLRRRRARRSAGGDRRGAARGRRADRLTTP